MFERDPNKTSRNRGPSRERSNKHSPVRAILLMAAKEVEESSGCVNLHPMPPAY